MIGLSLIVPFHVQDDLVLFSDLVYAATLICPRLDPRPACLDDLVDLDDLLSTSLSVHFVIGLLDRRRIGAS